MDVRYLSDSRAIFSLEMDKDGLLTYCKHYTGGKDCFTHLKENQHMIALENGYFLLIMEQLEECRTYFETEVIK